MLVSPDFSEVAEAVTPGIYKVRVKGVKAQETKTGLPMLSWQLETYGEAESRNNGRTIFHRTILSGPAAWQIRDFYRAATGQALAGNFETDQLLGKELEVRMEEEEYQGQTSVKVKAVRAVTAN